VHHGTRRDMARHESRPLFSEFSTFTNCDICFPHIKPKQITQHPYFASLLISAPKRLSENQLIWVRSVCRHDVYKWHTGGSANCCLKSPFIQITETGFPGEVYSYVQPLYYTDPTITD
jgi:hypothetical protein